MTPQEIQAKIDELTAKLTEISNQINQAQVEKGLLELAISKLEVLRDFSADENLIDKLTSEFSEK